MRITSKGQVTIPKRIRDAAGLNPNTEVEFVYDGDTVTIVQTKRRHKKDEFEQMLRRARGRATVKMSTDEIIDMMRGPPAEV